MTAPTRSRDAAPAPTDPATTPAHADLVLYGDFSNVLCYLASQRMDLLARTGVGISWRAIEGERDLSVMGRRHDEESSAAALRAIVDARAHLRLGEEVPNEVPSLLPKTEAAISAFAEADAAGVSDEVRRRLFTAYWVDGINIGDPERLRNLLATSFMLGHATCDAIREFGYAVAMTRSPLTGAAWRLIRDWRRQWLELSPEQLPLPVLRSGSRTESGAAALQWLGDLLDERQISRSALVTRELGPGSSSADLSVTVAPPPTWTSQVGDPWCRAGRMRSR